MSNSQRVALAAVLLYASFSCAAWAHDTRSAQSGVQRGDVNVLFSVGRKVDSQRLDRQRGGLDTSNRNSLDGSVHDTSATNVVTGSNSIADGSFVNSAGLPTVIQNTGANVLIQNATIVNVQFK